MPSVTLVNPRGTTQTVAELGAFEHWVRRNYAPQGGGSVAAARALFTGQPATPAPLAASTAAAPAQTAATIPTTITTPRDIAGLALWLDATQITGVATGGPVATWNDASGNTRHATQATGAAQPAYVTAALGGNPVVRFDGTNDALIAPYRGEPGTVIVVGRGTAANTDRSYLGARSAEGGTIDGWYFQANSPGDQMRFSRADTRSATAVQLIAQMPTTTAYHIQIGTFDYATRTAALYNGGGNAQKVRTTDPKARPLRCSAAMAVGAAYRAQTLADFLAGDIAEVLVYDRRLTDAELNLLGPYLAGKWAVPFTPVVSPPPVAAQYIAATFTYDTPRTPFHIAASDDGANFRHVNGGTPAFAGPQGDSRDPSIMRHTDGFYYVAYTHSYHSNSFGIARSDDLLVWEWVGDITPNLAGVTETWAPEFFVDDDGSVHVLVSLSTNNGGTFALYEMKAQDGTFKAWTAPVKITGTNLPATMIDGSIIKIGATYYLYYKGPTYSERLKSTSLTSGYTVDKTGNWGGWATPAGPGYEGPSLYEVNGRYRLVGDDGTFKFSESDDDTASAAWGPFTPVTFDAPAYNMRHGTVVRAERGGTGKPVPRPAGGGGGAGLAAVATSGSYNDLIDKPAGAAAIAARIHKTTNQTLAAGSGEVQADMAATTWSYGGMTVNLAEDGIVAPVKGLYMLTGQAQIYAAAGGFRSIIAKVDYTKITEVGRTESAGFEGPFPIAIPLVLNAGNLVNITAYAGGVAATLTGNAAGTATWISLAFLGSIP